MIFRGDENLKKNFFIANVNVYRYSKLKETRNAFDCIIIGSRSKNNYFW